jgi:hypothetical protein
MKMFPTIAGTLPLLVSASAAMAGSFTGTWPLTVSHSQHYDGNLCLTLTEDGGFGGPQSGLASIAGEPHGTFRVIGHIILVAIQEPSDTGQNAGLVFTAGVSDGSIGRGVTAVIYGGEAVDSGVVKFGKKGGC